MSAGKLLGWLLFVPLGGVAAWMVSPRQGNEVKVWEGHGHSSEYFYSASSLPRNSSLYGPLEDLAERLTDGTATAQTVNEATTLLLDCLQKELRPSSGDVKLELLSEGVPFGYLKMGEETEGYKKWAFEFTIDAPPRFGDMAEKANIAVHYRGIGGTFTELGAVAETKIHLRRANVERIAPKPLCIGGAFSFDATSANWQRLMLGVEVPEGSGVPLWSSKFDDIEPREDSLGAADSGFVAAALFSL